jgi:hypothetical protein
MSSTAHADACEIDPVFIDSILAYDFTKEGIESLRVPRGAFRHLWRYDDEGHLLALRPRVWAGRGL